MLETVVTALRNVLSKPITVPFPHESIPFAEGYRGRHEFDPNSCISCGMCQKVCPNKAIEMIAAPENLIEEFPKTYPRVDLGKCCFCGLCSDVCPKGALKLSKDVFLSTFDPGTTFVEPFPKLKKWYKKCHDRTAQRRRVPADEFSAAANARFI